MKNVRRGVRMGLGVALGFSLIAALLSLAVGENGFESIHVSFLYGIAAYLAAGVCVGAIGGVLTPMMGSAIGLSLTGLVLGWLADLVFQIAQKGTNVWRDYDWFEALGVALISIPGAFYIRARVRARSKAANGNP